MDQWPEVVYVVLHKTCAIVARKLEDLRSFSHEYCVQATTPADAWLWRSRYGTIDRENYITVVYKKTLNLCKSTNGPFYHVDWAATDALAKELQKEESPKLGAFFFL